MKKALIFALIAIVLVGSVALSRLNSGEDARQVDVAKAEFKPIRSSILASGSLSFREQVQLRSEVIAKVIEMHVEESDRVQKDQLLITLDPRSYQAQVDQAAAAVRIQSIAIERQRLLLQNLQKRYTRQKAMFEANLVDADSFDSLENQLGLAQVDLRSHQEALSQARAALEQSQELLDKTRIRSPIDGIVIQLDLKVGETVIAGTTNIPGSTMMVIADTSETLAEVQVDEADIANVTEGQSADVFPAAWSNTALSGQVQTIATVARAAAGQRALSFLVKILLDEQQALKIRPGMSVRADIYTQVADNSLAVPIGAIRYDEKNADESNEDEDQAYVFVMQGGKAKRKNVSLGLSSDSDQEILSGVAEGEQVITGPYRVLKDLRDDMAVELKKEEDEGDRVISISTD